MACEDEKLSADMSTVDRVNSCRLAAHGQTSRASFGQCTHERTHVIREGGLQATAET